MMPAATKQINCGGCDNCLAPRQTWDATLAAQKFLSCVYRIREKSGFGVGVEHVVEVLCGADTEKVRKFGHHSLSTYGIGKEHDRADWGNIGGAQLVRLGFLVPNAEKFNILELTDEGRAALKTRQKITLTKPVSAPEPPTIRPAKSRVTRSCSKPRASCKQLADERGVPSYIMFSDVALRQMARFYPPSDREFSRISGVGKKK